MIDERFVFLAFVLSMVGVTMYLIDIFKGRVKPNLVTWILWALAPLIATGAQISEGAGLRAVHTFATGFGPLLIVFASLYNRRSIYKAQPRHYFFGALSLIGLVLWAITGEGIVALVFAILADGFAALPTIEKLYKYPETENGLIFGFGILAATLTLLTIDDWQFEQYGFSLYILLVTLVIFAPTLVAYIKRIATNES